MNIELPLRGPAGEPVDLWRTIMSHGVASLPPLMVDETTKTLTATLQMPKGKPRTVIIRAAAAKRKTMIDVVGPAPTERQATAILAAVRHILALDRDLSGFYAAIKTDPDLSWASAGAGRMVRSQTVFEEVVKTVCTTNCAWSATERMVGAMVRELGESAYGGAHAFPTAERMAETPEQWYRDVARAGYRGAYFRSLARMVADGEVDLEAMGSAEHESDDILFKQFQTLPGVGPYAAAHIMTMIGRHSRPILDSWTRPKYARMTGKKSVTDAQILKRFKRYGPHAGLAFWLFVTQDWA
ncbi:MAG: hypothetical protein NVSMB57_00480 [Actinomycetota bacterium]